MLCPDCEKNRSTPLEAPNNANCVDFQPGCQSGLPTAVNTVSYRFVNKCFKATPPAPNPAPRNTPTDVVVEFVPSAPGCVAAANTPAAAPPMAAPRRTFFAP